MSVPDRARPVTAADVARRAGVSRATVSHILNGRDAQFRDDTKARVLAVSAELDYRPSPAGRNLVTGRGDTVVVVVPTLLLGINLPDAFEAIIDSLGSRANVVLRFADADPASTLAALLKLRPLAVVDFGSLPTSQRDRLAAQGIPCVPDYRRPIRNRGEEMQDAIAGAQVSELLRRGPRRIVYAGLSSPRMDPFEPGRLAGVEHACAAAGLPAPLRIEIEPKAAAKRRGIENLPDGPVGIAAYNDTVAIALLTAARSADIDIPDRLTIVGMDASDVGQLISPRLTSVAVDMRAIVRDATRQMSSQLGDLLGVEDVIERYESTEQSLVEIISGETT